MHFFLRDILARNNEPHAFQGRLNVTNLFIFDYNYMLVPNNNN